MPIYRYECQDCQEQFDGMASISKRDDPQECPACGVSNSQKLISAPNLNFPGDGWASKNLRVEKQMRDKNMRLAKREAEMKRSGQVPKLVPNVGGERTESWSEAAKLAKSQGKSTTGYERRARKEKAAS